MNRKLQEIQISLKNLKKQLPTNDDDLNIKIHWDNDFIFEVKIPLNKNYKRR